MLIVFGLPQRCHSWRCFIISSKRHSCHWAMSNTSLGYLRFKQTVELLTHPLLTCKYKREWPADPQGQLQRVAIREKRERNNWLHRENRQNKKRNEPHSSIPGQHKEAKCNCVLGKEKNLWCRSPCWVVFGFISAHNLVLQFVDRKAVGFWVFMWTRFCIS